MTITSQNRRTVFTAPGGVTTFGFPWRVIDEGDNAVILTDTAGVETVQTLNTDYTVLGVGNAFGLIEFTVAPTINYEVHIYLDPPVVQLTDYTANGPFPAESHEGALDSLTLICKRLMDLASRALGLSDGTTDGSGSYDVNGNKVSNMADPTLIDDASTKGYVDAAVVSAQITPSVLVSTQGADLIDETSFDDMLTKLGGGSKGIPIFKDTSSASVLNELGVSAYIQGLLPQPDVGASLTYLTAAPLEQMPRPNVVVNGDFQVWQNGVGFTAPADDTYTADQFVVLTASAGAVNVQELTTSYPAYSRGGMSVFQTTGNDNVRWGIVHPIDFQRTRPLRGYTVSGSVDTIGTSDLTGMRFRLIEWTGAADSPTTDVVSDWATGATTEPTLAGSWAYVSGADVAVTVGASWATASFEGATISAGATNLALFMYTNDASFTFGGSASLGTTAWNLVPDIIATQFQSKSYTQELADCQRFFQKTFPAATAPADNTASVAGAVVGMTGAHGGGATSEQVSAQWQFSTPMIDTPTVTAFNPYSGTAAYWVNAGDTLSLAPVIVAQGERGAFFYTTVGSPTSNEVFYIHATADARF